MLGVIFSAADAPVLIELASSVIVKQASFRMCLRLLEACDLAGRNWEIGMSPSHYLLSNTATISPFYEALADHVSILNTAQRVWA